MQIIVRLNLILLSFLYLSCSSSKELINIIELKYLGQKIILEDYSSSDFNLNNNTFGTHYTVVKKGKQDSVVGINLSSGLVSKVLITEIVPEPYLKRNTKGYFSYVNDSLLVYVSSVAEENLNDNHDRIIRIYNLNSKILRFFSFDGIPVLISDSLGRFSPILKAMPHSELNYSKWSFNFNAVDSSMYVSIVKVLTTEKELTYTGSDKFLIAKINLNKSKNEIHKTRYPVFHSFGDVRFKDRVRPYSDFYSNKILMGYPAHLDIYQFNIQSHVTKKISVNSKLVPNELYFNDNYPINAYNTEFFRVQKNLNGNGIFRVAHTQSKELIGMDFRNYLDYRSLLIWKKDNGEVAECYLDKKLWSIAYVKKDTLYCTAKITKDTKALTLEKYLIVGCKTTYKENYLRTVFSDK